MDALKNPFAPGAGTPPPALVGREEILTTASVALGRIAQGRPEKSFFLVGLRGVGKTVLLNRIQELADQQNYRTVFIEVPENKNLPELLIPHLRRVLLALDRGERTNEHVKRALAVLKGFANAVKINVGEFEFGLNIDAAFGVADSGDLEADLTELLLALGHAAQARHMPVALIVDEVQYLRENALSALIMAFHKIAQKQLPLILIGAGLPQLVGLMGKSKSYAERLFSFPKIGPLEKNDAINALQKPVQQESASFTDEALDDIYDTTQGYPYFLQEWGYQAWNTSPASPITRHDIAAARQVVIRQLDESFFRVRFDRLTPREKDYLRAMAELGPGPHRSGDIAALLNIHVRSAAPLRSGLILKGMIFSPSHGDTAFTVPLFDEFMKRIIPKFRLKNNLDA